jgi:predicted  nucleic acid-binding Zn-ribbon protein
MPSDTSVLFHNLHQVLKKLADAQDALSEAPRRIALGERQVARCSQNIEEQKSQILELQKSADELNLQLKTKEGEIQKLKTVLNQAASNREYDIVKGQIAAASEAKGQLEEDALLALEKIDAARIDLQKLEDVLENRKAELTAIIAEAAVEEPGLRAAVEQHESELAEIQKNLPSSEALVVLDRLRGAHGASACAEVDDEGFCSACDNKVTTQDGVRINMGEFICCRACGRILYKL